MNILLNKSLFTGLLFAAFLYACSESPKPDTAITVTNTDFADIVKPNGSSTYIEFEATKFTNVPTEWYQSRADQHGGGHWPSKFNSTSATGVVQTPRRLIVSNLGHSRLTTEQPLHRNTSPC